MDQRLAISRAFRPAICEGARRGGDLMVGPISGGTADLCQWPLRSAHWRPRKLPADGHGFCPLAATKTAHSPSQFNGTTPFPAVASVSR
jgi:hypothetical protein